MQMQWKSMQCTKEKGTQQWVIRDGHGLRHVAGKEKDMSGNMKRNNGKKRTEDKLNK